MLRQILKDDIELRAIRRHHQGEFHAFVEAGREHFVDWIPFVSKRRTYEDLGGLMDKFLSMYAEGSGEVYCLWKMGKIIGLLIIKDLDEETGLAEIGYMIDKEHEGRGLVRLSCELMLEYLFVERGLQKVRLCCDERNGRSVALAERLGFSLEGSIRRELLVNGAHITNQHFGLLREEWLERATAAMGGRGGH